NLPIFSDLSIFTRPNCLPLHPIPTPDEWSPPAAAVFLKLRCDRFLGGRITGVVRVRLWCVWCTLGACVCVRCVCRVTGLRRLCMLYVGKLTSPKRSWALCLDSRLVANGFRKFSDDFRRQMAWR